MSVTRGVWFCERVVSIKCNEMYLGSKPQSLHYCQGYIFCGTGERNQGYALLMKANKPETVLYRASTFSLLLASHGGISSCG